MWNIRPRSGGPLECLTKTECGSESGKHFVDKLPCFAKLEVERIQIPPPRRLFFYLSLCFMFVMITQKVLNGFQ